jgi:resuscitation-promoting factor RpfA
VTEIDPKLSRIYRESASEGPPAAIDAAILAAARERVAQPRRPARSSWARWMAPASALATLVVAVSLAFLMEREQPETLEGAAIRGVPPRPQSPAPARAPEAAKPQAADSAVPAAAEKKVAPAAPVRAPAAAAVAPRSAEPAAPAVQAVPAESRAKAAAPSATAPRAPESKMLRESNVASDSAPGAAGAAASAASAGAPPAATGKVAPLRQQALPRSPEAWLEEIGRLKREGRDKEAAEQLAEFRKAYPAYAVPENLLK